MTVVWMERPHPFALEVRTTSPRWGRCDGFGVALYTARLASPFKSSESGRRKSYAAGLRKDAVSIQSISTFTCRPEVSSETPGGRHGACARPQPSVSGIGRARAALRYSLYSPASLLVHRDSLSFPETRSNPNALPIQEQNTLYDRNISKTAL